MTNENEKVAEEVVEKAAEEVAVEKVAEAVEPVEKAEMPQDLAHHKTEETDNLVKAERPADDFMKDHDLDKETHGKTEEVQ